MGRTAVQIAEQYNISVPIGTRVLVSEQKFVDLCNPYAKEKLCPILAFYVEKDWRNACEKCIELLCNQGLGNVLVIHSRDEAIIREFSLKKPVSRVLVNTPATLGGMGATTNLFPAFTLGIGAAGGTITSDNVSPMNLVNIRKVGYGVRKVSDMMRSIGTISDLNATDSTVTMSDVTSKPELSKLIGEVIAELAKQGYHGGE